MSAPNPIEDQIRALLGTHFPGLVFCEKRSPGITTLTTAANQPLGISISLSPSQIVVEITVNLADTTPQKITSRIARSGSLGALDNHLARLRSSLLVWWGCIGDILGVG